ncbi:MAG: Glutathione S-transferase [Ramlibacter sp.]|nr:Glutathione S-transferase [Ramlibacter sp.]
MKILFSPFSPYVRKCLVAAHELGLNDKLQLLPSNAHPVNRDQEIIRDNPLGKVPTFHSDDGQVLYDSRVICEYLNDLARGSLFPASGTARWQALTLQALGDGMLDAALLARYEDVARPEALRWPEWRAAQLDKAETALAHLDARPALLAQRVDIGAITVGCALWYLDLRFADFGWRDRHPQVAQWYATFGQRPSMRAQWAL